MNKGGQNQKQKNKKKCEKKCLSNAILGNLFEFYFSLLCCPFLQFICMRGKGADVISSKITSLLDIERESKKRKKKKKNGQFLLYTHSSISKWNYFYDIKLRKSKKYKTKLNHFAHFFFLFIFFFFALNATIKKGKVKIICIEFDLTAEQVLFQ